MDNGNATYSEGHFVGAWLAISMVVWSGIAMVMGIASGNPGLFVIGLPMGLAFGLTVGTSVEAKYKRAGKIRPLTKEEKKKNRLMGITLLVIGITAFLFLLLSL